MKYEWDIFISHATEDKDDFVRSLANGLKSEGIAVWYDEQVLKLGDSIRRSVEHGLSNSKFGIVVLSPHFFRKSWPQKELSYLVARESAENKVILPIWHNVSIDEVKTKFPLLADIFSISSSMGTNAVIAKILEVFYGISKSTIKENITVIKQDDSTETYSRVKLWRSLVIACQKRPVPECQIEEIINNVEKEILNRNNSTINSRDIFNLAVEQLHKVDEVAYVRYASVYRQFHKIDDFMNELTDLLRKSGES